MVWTNRIDGKWHSFNVENIVSNIINNNDKINNVEY